MAGGDRIYTVDEVSEMLGLPRPTLYRYLKEYPVPYARRSGRIRIPEESLGRIRTVRELHGEGLGTEAVKRRLRGGTPEGREEHLAERLDRISESLEGLRGGAHASEVAIEAPLSGAVRTLLARQTLLISAVFDISEMLEELLAANGRPRKTTFPGAQLESPLSDDVALVRRGPTPQTSPGRVVDAQPGRPRAQFGSLTRRRRAALALLSLAVLATLAALAWVALFA